ASGKKAPSLVQRGGPLSRKRPRQRSDPPGLPGAERYDRRNAQTPGGHPRRAGMVGAVSLGHSRSAAMSFLPPLLSGNGVLQIDGAALEAGAPLRERNPSRGSLEAQVGQQ